MNAPPDVLRLLAPEIIVAVTGMGGILLDLICPAPHDSEPVARPWLAYVGIAGLLAAGASAVPLADEQGVLFEGLIVLDPLSAFFRLLFIGIAVVVLLLATDTLPRFSRWAAEFHALVIWCTLGHMLLASTGELFTIFLALQLTSLPLIVLIGFAKKDGRSGEASLKYLLLVLVSTAVLLYGITLIYGSLGTSTIAEVGELLAGREDIPAALALGLVLLVTGFGFKITAVPFHYWVPDVYTGAPTPVTAFLSVGSKFAGFALALRIIITGLHVPLDWPLIFGVLAVSSMTLGNLAAIPQTDIKRMLAYSGIAQAGYLLIGVAALTQSGISSLLFYMVSYAFANLAAFTAVIIFAESAGSTRIEDYAGLSRRAPLTALALAISLLSLAGMPLMGGFMAKFYVFASAVETGLLWVVTIGVLNSVVSLYYYLRVVWQVYVAEGPAEKITVKPRAALVLSVCTLGVLALGIFPEPVMRIAAHAASALFGG
jgi:NADH-quinone oxidoreductase subunit N